MAEECVNSSLNMGRGQGLRRKTREHRKSEVDKEREKRKVCTVLAGKCTMTLGKLGKATRTN